MPIQFTCPHCGMQTHVSDEYAGRTGPCAGCGNPVTIPAPGWAPAAAPPKRTSSAVMVVVVLAAALGFMVVCGGILTALLLPAVQAAREAARRAACTNHLKQVSVAMFSYEATWGCFPPAYLADEDGQPMHSWRVLLLPYLDEQMLYDQYNFDEPWDSPGNRALADRMPEVYQCPSDRSAGPSETSYAMIVGPGTISDGPTSTRSDQIQISDGSSNTLMVVEAAGSGIHWMEPRDLPADEISYFINDPVDPGIHSDHPGCANVAMCDGAVQALDDSTEPEQVEAMTTIGGGEEIDIYAGFPNDFDY